MEFWKLYKINKGGKIMGTNYYMYWSEGDVCPHCGRGEKQKEYHLGKSLAGWCFALHVDPELSINNLYDLERFYTLTDNVIIKNEYRTIISWVEFINVVKNREFTRDFENPPPALYDSWKEFHRENNSVSGPNGLVRSKIDGKHCVGHGEGTWDYILGEFS